jgi:hypothetical protein
MMKTLIRGFKIALKGELLLWAIFLGFSAIVYLLQQIF